MVLPVCAINMPFTVANRCGRDGVSIGIINPGGVVRGSDWHDACKRGKAGPLRRSDQDLCGQGSRDVYPTRLEVMLSSA